MTRFRRAALVLAAIAAGCTERQPAASTKATKASGPRVEISMVTSTAKRQWIETAIRRFREDRPDVKVLIKFAGSNEEIRDLLSGADRPTVFSPSEGALLTDLDVQWRAAHGSGLIAPAGDERPRSLLRTPFVFLCSESAAGPIVANSPDGTFSWAALQAEIHRRRAAKLPPLRIGHVAFSKGSSGLNSLLLMGIELFGPAITAGQVEDERLARKMEEIEANTTLIAPTTSALATRFSQGGSEALDVIFTYENTASELVRTLAERSAQPFRMYYPGYTMWSDQPGAILQGDWVTPEQHEAARAWIAFLVGPVMQREAARMELRPNDASMVDMVEGPFAELKKYGFKRDLPPAAPKPGEAVTRALVALAQRSRPPSQVALR